MTEGRAKKSARNIVYRLSSQVLNIILKFITRTVFIRFLGIEYLGINGLFSEILQMLALADLGFNTAMVFSMYEPLAHHNEEKIAQLIGLYKKIYRIIAVSISVIGVLLIPFLSYLVNIEKPIPLLRVYYLLYLANTVASYLVVYKTSILNADQKYYVISKYDMIFNITCNVVCCLVIFTTRNFLIYLITQVLFTYIKNLYCSHIAGKMYPYINQKVNKLPSDETKKIFNNVKSVFIYKLATTLIGSTDNILISVLISTVTVGIYSNYGMVVNSISVFITLVFSSMTSSIGNLIVESNKQKNFSVYKTIQFISFTLSTFTISCTFSLLNDLIVIWLGHAYEFNDNNILIISSIALNMYFSIVLMPIWSYREATGMYRQTKYIMVLTAICNLFLSCILGKLLGLAGILFATSLSRLLTYFWYEPKILFKQFFGTKVYYYYYSILKNFFITLLVTSITFYIFSFITSNNWISFVGKAVLVALFSFVFTILFYFKNPEFKNVKSRLAQGS